MYYVQNLKDFKLYQKSIELYETVIKEIKIYDNDFYTIKKKILKIINNIALANGKSFYSKVKVEHYRYVINTSYSLEDILKLKLNYKNKDKYVSLLKEIRCISFTLKKKEEKLMELKETNCIISKPIYTDYISKDVKELKAYQITVSYIKECREIINSLPTYEYDIKDQLRRSSTSILSNLSEGHGYADIYYKKAINSYNVALGSLKESIAQIHICYICNYISKDSYEYLDSIANQIVALVVTYIRNMSK